MFRGRVSKARFLSALAHRSASFVSHDRDCPELIFSLLPDRQGKVLYYNTNHLHGHSAFDDGLKCCYRPL